MAGSTRGKEESIGEGGMRKGRDYQQRGCEEREKEMERNGNGNGNINGNGSVLLAQPYLASHQLAIVGAGPGQSKYATRLEVLVVPMGGDKRERTGNFLSACGGLNFWKPLGGPLRTLFLEYFIDVHPPCTSLVY